MKRYNYSILFVLIFITGCQSFSEITIDADSYDVLNNKNYYSLNGTYSNTATQSNSSIEIAPHGGSEIEMRLYQIVSNSTYSNKFENKKVEIEFVNAKKGMVFLYENDTLVDKNVFRGKFKDGYFYSRRKGFVVPLIPLIFSYNFNRFRIKKSNNLIIVDYIVNKAAYGVFLGYSEKGSYSGLYEKINK